MNRMLWIQTMIVLAVLLASTPLLIYAAEPVTADNRTAGPAWSSETGATWTCTYEPKEVRAEYYTGRAGQLERRAGRRNALGSGRLECRALTGDEVKVFKDCRP